MATVGEGMPHTGRVHAGEWYAVGLSFAYFFCVLAAYYMIRPVRDQLTAAVGSTQLPWFYAASFLATLALTPVFAALVSRYPRRIVVPIVYGFFIACLLGFVPFFAMPRLLDARTLGAVFFVWLNVFNLFVVSVFWSFMTDIWDESQARRLFPIIALAGTAGAVAGPVLTGLLVGVIGVAPLLLVSALLLGASLIMVVLLGRWSQAFNTRREGPQETAVGGGMFDGIKQLFGNPFMRTMALLLLFGDWIGTVNYALVVDYSKATFHDAISRTQFAAALDLGVNCLAALTQLTLSRWLLVRYGAGAPIAVWAAVTVGVLLWVVGSDQPYAPVIGSMPVVAIALIVNRGLTYGMVGPARESLFTLVPRSLRYKGKNAVDTAVWRFGDMTVALAMTGLRAAGVGVGGFAALSAAVATVSGVMGWRLASRVRALAASSTSGS